MCTVLENLCGLAELHVCMCLIPWNSMRTYPHSPVYRELFSNPSFITWTVKQFSTITEGATCFHQFSVLQRRAGWASQVISWNWVQYAGVAILHVRGGKTLHSIRPYVFPWRQSIFHSVSKHFAVHFLKDGKHLHRFKQQREESLFIWKR